MIINFTDFLNEYSSYNGAYGTAGFIYSEPSNNFIFNLNLKNKSWFSKNNNEETISLVKRILSKYNIPYEKLTLNDNKLNVVFKSYSKYEVSSIINSLLVDLSKNKIIFDPRSISVNQENEIKKRPIGFNR